MKSKKLRILAVVIILIATIVAFIYYFISHPLVVDSIKKVPPQTFVLIIGLYTISTLVLATVTYYTLAVGRIKIPFKENILLTCYSSVINFFGPLQSGPGARVAYLKKRHNISIKNYLFASLIYYGFFSLFSAVFLCINSLAWWKTVLVVMLIAAVSIFIIKRKSKVIANFSVETVVKLALVTLLQVFVTSVIYFVELHSLNTHVSFSQAMTYTGAANFALFVSLTPGAIGFRESFLLLSHRLHHINSSQILAASAIDRTVYVVFLGLLFIFSVAFHFSDKFKTQEPSKQTASEPV